MATLIGVVSQVVGEVFAVASDGTRRTLLEGDRVFAGEQLVTGPSGAVAIALTNGQELTLGRDSSLPLGTQQLAAGNESAVAPTSETPAPPSEAELTDVQRLQAAIEAGLDPTLEGEATAAGPGAGSSGGGAGGGNSFVLLDAVGGALEPEIGFPTEGLLGAPEFPDGEIAALDDEAPDLPPVVDNGVGLVITGPGVVDEAALNGGPAGGGQPGSNPESPAESTQGALSIDAPDGIGRIEVLDASGVWVNVLGGGVVQGVYGTLTFDADGNWTYTLGDNSLDHSNPNAIGADDQLFDPFSVRVFDLDNDVSPTVPLNIAINDDGPSVGQTTVSVTLDDEGLVGGINGGPDDAPGSATSVSGNLAFNAGADGLKSIALSGPNNLGTEAVSSEWDAASNTLTISSGRGALVSVVLTDPASGAYTVNLLQPLLHPEAGIEDDIVLNIGYTVTDGDDDTATGSLAVTINDDTPTIQAGSLGNSASVTFEGSDAGYLNSYGYYTKAVDGSPQSGQVIWANVKEVAPGTDFDLEGLDPANTGFFIIPNGAANSAIADGTPLTFQLIEGKWQAFAGSTPLIGADGANVLFSDANLNPGGAHLQDTADLGNQNWEDKTSTSDWDYNDVNVSVTWGGQLQVDESDFSLDASRDFSGVFTVQAGADGQRSLTYDLTLAAADPDTGLLDSGLVDSLSGQPVYLSLNPEGVAEGRTSDGKLVFSVSVNAAGVVVLDQVRAIVHPTSDPDEPKSLLADVLGLRATVTDNDGDTASTSLDLGQLISFKDDGPLAIDDVAAPLSEGGAVTVASGNVLSNDQAGADGGKAFVTWNTSANGAAMTELAKYGALVLDPATGQYMLVASW